jgi:hypothetical protein
MTIALQTGLMFVPTSIINRLDNDWTEKSRTHPHFFNNSKQNHGIVISKKFLKLYLL